MSMEIEGKVAYVGETQTFGSGFQKRVVIVECQEDGSKYENLHGFELLKDRVDKLDGINVGDQIEVKFNLGRAREYEGKWYADHHTAWFIKKIGEAEVPTVPVVADNPDPDDTGIPF